MGLCPSNVVHLKFCVVSDNLTSKDSLVGLQKQGSKFIFENVQVSNG